MSDSIKIQEQIALAKRSINPGSGWKCVITKVTHPASRSPLFGFHYERASNALIDRVSYSDPTGWEGRIVAVIS